MSRIGACSIVFAALLLGAPAHGAPQAGSDPIELVKEGRKLNAAGKQDEALALYERALRLDPKLFDAHLAAGIALDLKGDYVKARAALQRAIDTAPDEAARNQGLGAMAVSYAFERNAAEASKYYQQQFNSQLKAGGYDGAAATANALARVYLESGDTNAALKWYETGYTTSKKIPTASPDQVDLWELRWLHARSRIAARKGDQAEATKDADAVKAIVDKGGLNEEQRPAYQYLLGYDAFYVGRFDTAIAELLKADQRDPFILGLLAQAYDKKGDTAKAREYYARVLESNAHNLQNAFSRPLARRRLAELK
jgi:tetratricopeptide (TPR) repeat protein